jgi:hypothetical protein
LRQKKNVAKLIPVCLAGENWSRYQMFSDIYRLH